MPPMDVCNYLPASASRSHSPGLMFWPGSSTTRQDVTPLPAFKDSHRTHLVRCRAQGCSTTFCPDEHDCCSTTSVGSPSQDRQPSLQWESHRELPKVASPRPSSLHLQELESSLHVASSSEGPWIIDAVMPLTEDMRALKGMQVDPDKLCEKVCRPPFSHSVRCPSPSWDTGSDSNVESRARHPSTHLPEQTTRNSPSSMDRSRRRSPDHLSSPPPPRKQARHSPTLEVAPVSIPGPSDREWYTQCPEVTGPKPVMEVRLADAVHSLAHALGDQETRVEDGSSSISRGRLLVIGNQPGAPWDRATEGLCDWWVKAASQEEAPPSAADSLAAVAMVAVSLRDERVPPGLSSFLLAPKLQDEYFHWKLEPKVLMEDISRRQTAATLLSSIALLHQQARWIKSLSLQMRDRDALSDLEGVLDNLALCSRAVAQNLQPFLREAVEKAILGRIDLRRSAFAGLDAGMLQGILQVDPFGAELVDGEVLRSCLTSQGIAPHQAVAPSTSPKPTKKQHSHQSNQQPFLAQKDQKAKCNVLVEAVEPQELPPAKKKPVLQLVPSSYIFSCNKVFFDLETTSCRLDCGIIQIAAAHDNETFNKYILPTQPISSEASNITGLANENNILTLHNKPVDAITLQSALQNFLEWLEQRSPVLLFAHNAQFDYKRFFYSINNCNLVESFQGHIIGFVDTLALFKVKYPNLKDRRQPTLVREFLKKSYEEHNAQDDALTLQELYRKTQPHDSLSSSCSFKSAYDKWQYDTVGKTNKFSFRNMIFQKCVSEDMALKMGKSGLTMAKLCSVHKKYGCKGVEELLAQKDELGKPRVTKNKRVIEGILKFLCK